MSTLRPLRRISFAAAAPLAAALASLTVAPRTALAEAPGPHALPMALLAVDSDDAEQQAEGLTGALRSHVRAADGLSLVDTSQSIGILTAALRCPQRPTPDCQTKIADQLRIDAYVWGLLAKAGKGEVTAELHFYRRGRPEIVATETYAENLKDQNDDALKRVATKLVDTLASQALGTLHVEVAKAPSGSVKVDAGKTVPLASGVATLRLPPGTHNIVVEAPGLETVRKTLSVTPGGAERLALTASPDGAPILADDGKPFPTQKVLGWTAIGLGAAGLVVGGVFGAQWIGLQADNAALKDDYPGVDPRTGQPADACALAGLDADADLACKNDDAARGKAIGWVFAGVGAALVGGGIVLLATAPSGDAPKDAPKAAKRGVRLLPSFGPTGGGVSLGGRF